MKIGQFVAYPGPGGAESFVSRLSKTIRGDKVEVYVAPHLGRSRDWLRETYRHSGIDVVILPDEFTRLWGTKQLLKLGWKFGKFLKERNVDVLHSHMFPNIIRGSIAAKFAGIPHVATLHDIYTVEEKPSRIRLLQAAALLGTKIVTVSENMEEVYRSFGYFSKDAMRTIYNGVDLETFYPSVVRSVNTFTVISVGRLEEVKGYDRLIRGFGFFVDHASSFEYPRLRVVGDGSERENLENLVKELNLESHVEFLGTRTDIPNLLRQSDCFALTSHSEGLSCSIIEAMASGLPVVCTDVGGNSELVAHGENGLLIPKYFALSNLSGALDHVRRNGGDMRTASRMIATRDFNMLKTADNYLGLYDSLVRL